MTLPDERLNAVNQARHFLRALLDPRITPKVPRVIRKQAYYVLRHFPADFEMEKVAMKCPEIFRLKMD